MIRILSVENMRKSDAYTIENFTSGKELMMRAGKGVFAESEKRIGWKAPVAIVCGSGNNGGDGYVIAGLLHDEGIDCTLFLLSNKFSEDGKYYYDQAVQKGIQTVFLEEAVDIDFSGFNTIADCILGTGSFGELRGLAKAVVEKINESEAAVVGVDMNTGLGGNNGIGTTCVKSDLTVAIGDFKPGHFLNMAKDQIKEKVSCDIGIEPIDRPYFLIEEDDIKGLFRKRKNFANKGDYGYIALVGGSVPYSGAIRLADMANTAMCTGAGVVKLAVPESICAVTMPHILESTLYPLAEKDGYILFDSAQIDGLIKNVKTVAFGMGIGNTEETQKTLEYILEKYEGILVVDADGLNALAKVDQDTRKAFVGKLVVTPHLKEFSGLTKKTIDEILQNPIVYAEEYAKEENCIVLLKGPTTIITDGETTYLTDRGCGGMATAGSGDVLSGIMAAVCGYSGNENLLLAVVAAAYINGAAGEKAQEHFGSISMTAKDTASFIKEVVMELEE